MMHVGTVKGRKEDVDKKIEICEMANLRHYDFNRLLEVCMTNDDKND